MKIYNVKPNGNENAEYVGTDYLKFSLSMIEDDIDWLKKTKDVAQSLLANIELLLLISERYRVDANLLIKKDQVTKWQEVFNKWYERVNKRIPDEFREGIRKSAEELFAELEQYGH